MKKPIRFYIILTVVFLFTAFVARWLYLYAEDNLYQDTILAHKSQTHQQIHALMREHQNSSMTLALSLSSNPQIKNLLQPSAQSHIYRKQLTGVIEQINQRPGFENLWLQLIDVKGNSVFRSWTHKYGDSLLGVRQEVREMLSRPEPKQVRSVGKFTLSFKSMMPVMDGNQQLIGIVEIITQFTPLTKKLWQEQSIDSVLLTDKQYSKQLTRADQNRFLNGYLVTNTDVGTERIQSLMQNGVEQFTQISDYYMDESELVYRYPLLDEKGRLLAHWLTFVSRDRVNFEQATWVLQRYAVISAIAILLTLLVSVLVMHARQSERDKRYYRQIIDSVSEIVYISNYQKIVDSNRHFFDFFDEFDSIEAFLKRYTCVCDRFLPGKGYLQKQMDGEYWLDYVLKRPHETHKAKIMRHGKEYIFSFQVQSMQGQKERLYTILMNDITKMEKYREELQTLTVTDELTKVGNRLACNQALSHEIGRAHRYATALSVVMFDLDHFKAVNDQFGHDVGDLVLRQTAKVIAEKLRETDSLCRFGGEEFIVVLPETTLECAKQTAERLRQAVIELGSDKVPTPISISLGVATLTQWDSEDTLLKRVDQALYQAKQNGRNRVEVAIDYHHEAAVDKA